MSESRDYYELTQPVFFVGFMGAGKTTTARKLARMCNLTSIDLDCYIERAQGRTIASIYADEGEEAFRAIEAQILRELAAGDPSLISCGGGIIASDESRATLKERGTVVYLLVGADEAKSRISNFSNRPLFGDIENARELNQSRMPYYEDVADIIIDTKGLKPVQVAKEVRRALVGQGVLLTKSDL